MKPRVTVGVCVKNAEATIKEAIDSILSQDFAHEYMEVIFVDDGSEDGTLSVIFDSISNIDMQVKVHRQEWKGLGVARNVVVNNANGDYIVWVDGDMTLASDFVRRQVEFMESNPAVGISKGKYGMRDVESNLIANLENMECVIDDFKCGGKAGSKPLGTGGSIYRVKAIREVGGFDENITGVVEDMDAEYRIRAAGWLLRKTPAVFYERRRETWKALWDEYFWHGYGGHYFFHKHGVRALSTFDKMFPPTAILVEFLRSLIAYRLTSQKAVFLLPLHWAFKRIAWCLGFFKGHIKGHGHARQLT